KSTSISVEYQKKQHQQQQQQQQQHQQQHRHHRATWHKRAGLLVWMSLPSPRCHTRIHPQGPTRTWLVLQSWNNGPQDLGLGQHGEGPPLAATPQATSERASERAHKRGAETVAVSAH
ncbi:hypothetical protein E4U54_005524, partial [Claviceps lovelessii]